jgi:ABC-type branched-subunit amino acid transport system substrate-binding protein
MALTGKFSETPFADLVQFYASSRQTVAVTVTLPDGQGEDGVFYIENGDVVDAWLGDAMGRDAVRRAMRLADGSFRIEPNIHAAERTITEPLQQLLLEETVQLDEERRAMRRAALTRRAGAPLPLPRAAPSAASERAGSGAALAARHLAIAPAARSGADAAREDPKGPARETREGGTGGPSSKVRVFLAVAGMAVLLAAGAVLFTRSGLSPGARGKSRAATAAGARESESAAASAETLTFGMVSPLHGPDKELGRGMKTGVEIAFAAANEEGGVHGRKLALVALDDGGEPSRTAEVMRKLLENRRVFAVVGNAGTATAAAALPVVLERKVPFLGALGGAALRKDPPDRYVFVYRPSLAEETAAAVRYLVDVRRVAPGGIAVFSQDDDFGEAGWAGAAQQLKAYGQAPSRVVRATYRRNSADVDGAVKRFVAMGDRLKAVVMIATHRPAARLVEKLLAATRGVLFTNVSTVDTAHLAEDLVAAKVPAEGDLVVTQVVPLPTSRASAVMKYRALLEKYGQGEAPGPLSLEGWVVGRLLVEALRGAGADPGPEQLVAALEGLHDLDIGIGVKLCFSATDHQASHKIWGAAVDGTGAWHPIDLE